MLDAKDMPVHKIALQLKTLNATWTEENNSGAFQTLHNAVDQAQRHIANCLCKPGAVRVVVDHRG
jgi:hypothetical protein